ncbi:branched-chain amino acid transport system II carrier protein [Bacillus thuringiensis]|nr:branched-chain amino acid transport system II carrier protein [Bacillus thuringiensis]
MDKRIKISKIISAGLLLFAIIFGAGNLIYPPALGREAGEEWLPALMGFLTTDVGLTVIGIMAVALYNGHIENITNRVSSYFTKIYISIIYLFIGPLFVMPRSSEVVYKTGIAPLLGQHVMSDSFALPLFSLGFFLIAWLMALNSSKVMDYVGKYLTPILVMGLLILILMAIINPIGAVGRKSFGDYAFFEGFTKGYFTMDALGAFIPISIIVHTFASYGVQSNRVMAVNIAKAGVVAGIVFTIVYSGLTYIGATSSNVLEVKDGAEILAYGVHHFFGAVGIYVLMVIMFLACLTTVIGLITVGSQYFHHLFPFITYKKWTFISIVVSIVVSNAGLAQLEQIAGPILTVLYPVTIMLYGVALINKIYPLNRGAFIGSVCGAGFVAIIQLLQGYKIIFPFLTRLVEGLPLYKMGMPWVAPALLFGIIGMLITTNQSNAASKGDVE